MKRSRAGYGWSVCLTMSCLKCNVSLDLPLEMQADQVFICLEPDLMFIPR